MTTGVCTPCGTESAAGDRVSGPGGACAWRAWGRSRARVVLGAPHLRNVILALRSVTTLVACEDVDVTTSDSTGTTSAEGGGGGSASSSSGGGGAAAGGGGAAAGGGGATPFVCPSECTECPQAADGSHECIIWH